MGRGDAGPRAAGSSRTGTLVLVLVLALVAGGALAWRYDVLDRVLDDETAAPVDPTANPAAVPAPPGLEVPRVRAPRTVAAPSLPSRARDLDRAALQQALAPYLSDRDLGKHVLSLVAPLRGPVVYRTGDATAVPASTTKLVTTAAALLALGPDHVFTTQVVPGARRGEVVLVGGGDPLLASTPDPTPDIRSYPRRADLTTLARQTARRLRSDGVRSVAVRYDDSLFTGPSVNPAWEPDYVPDDVVTPTHALWADQGRTVAGFSDRVPDPPAAAAGVFAQALRKAGVRVRAVSDGARSGADVGRPLASVESAPLSQIVEHILLVSDNEATEVLLRHVGVAESGDGSIEAGRAGVRALLSAAGVPFQATTLYDGSGLSRDNRMDPATLAGVLRLAADPGRPDLGALLTGLPVAGFTGSLTNRMDRGPAEGRGRVRAKTGTLRNVRSLAGVATDTEGTTFVFVLMADRIRERVVVEASAELDSAAAALGACACSVG